MIRTSCALAVFGLKEYVFISDNQKWVEYEQLILVHKRLDFKIILN